MLPAQLCRWQPVDVYVDPVSSIIPIICASVKRLFLIRLLLQVGQTLHHSEGTSGGAGHGGLAIDLHGALASLQRLATGAS